MEKIDLTFYRYKTPRALSDEQKQLLQEAKKALKKSYSPYSNFRVAAAVELSDGTILSGANFENASYPLCLCAERVALAAAAATHPGKQVVRMAITAKSKNIPQLKPIAPCGACRQVILETEIKQAQPIELILRGEKGDILVIPKGEDLLPLAFTGDSLLGD